jgi:transposase
LGRHGICPSLSSSPWMRGAPQRSSEAGGEGVAFSSPSKLMEMPRANDVSRSLTALDEHSTLVIVVELSEKSWLVAGLIPGVERHRKKKMDPGAEKLLGLLERQRGEAVKAGRPITRIAVAYEVGRDGFWLARWLESRGIETRVIHSTSVAVSREKRRAKTDRVDAEMLLCVFLGWLRGERGHCSMVAVPTIEADDDRRPGREREARVAERTRIINRMKADMARLGVCSFKPHLRSAPKKLAARADRRRRGGPAQHQGRARARHGAARHAARADRRDRENAARAHRGSPGQGAPRDDPPPAARVMGIGIETADLLVNEVMTRNLRDRRAVARYAGIAGSPEESGTLRREKGLSKSGNARVRRGMIQLPGAG